MSKFHPTRWTLLGSARDGDQASQAELVKLYRPPVLRYLAAAGAGAEAEDLAQEVFLRVFHRGVLEQAAPEAGRFRNLLLAVARNVLRADRTKRGAKKRGGDRDQVPLEEGLVSQEEQEAFDREWILALLQRAIERLEREHPNYHEAMVLLLEGHTPAQISTRLGRGAKDVRNHLHRARKALGRYLREEAWNYCARPEDHATELKLLGQYLSPNAFPST